MPVLQDARSLEIAWLYVPRSFTELHFFFSLFFFGLDETVCSVGSNRSLLCFNTMCQSESLASGGLSYFNTF